MSLRGASRWLEDMAEPGARALRQAMDEARPAGEEDAFARQRVWARVQAPWWSSSGKLAKLAKLEGSVAVAGRGGWLAPLLVGAGVALVAAVTTLASIGVLRSSGRSIVQGPVSQLDAASEVVPGLPRPTVALTAGPGRSTRHRLARGVDAELAPRTALVPGDSETAPEVKRGRVRFSVPHQAPGQRYSVRAGAFRVVVVGTVFDVSVEEEGVAVAVESGSVEVRDAVSDRALRLLSAGAQWSSVEKEVSPAAMQGPSARPAVRLVRKQPPRRLALATAGDPAAARTMRQANALRLRRDPARALALYQRMVEAGGPRADVALYSIGVIEDEDLNEPRRAAATWQRYRDRYPQGMLRVEADVSLIEVFTRLGEPNRALIEARAFLQNHPGSERRGEVARVAGDLARREGDCPAALRYYELALRSRIQAGDHDDALFYRAACLASARDPRVTGAVRSYLGRFPLGRHAVEAQRLLRDLAGNVGRP